MQPANNILATIAVPITITRPPASAFADEISLIFDGSGFSFSSPGLFQGKPALLPGDSFAAHITLTNEAQHKQLFMLSLDDPETLSTQDQILLDAANLVVSSEDGFLYYEGPLSGPDLYDSIVLKECDAGQSVELEIIIDVPSDLGNEYALSKDLLHWRFTALPAEDGMQEAWSHLVAIGTPGSAWDEANDCLMPAIAAGCAVITLSGLAFVLGKHCRK